MNRKRFFYLKMDTIRKYQCIRCNVIFLRSDQETEDIKRVKSMLYCQYCDTCRNEEKSSDEKMESLKKRIEILEERMKVLFPQEIEDRMEDPVEKGIERSLRSRKMNV